MPNPNILPDGVEQGLTVSQIGATLQTTSKDVGRLCSHPSIQKWSKFKPVRYNKLTGLTAAEFKAAHYGLSVPYVQQMNASSYYTLSTVRQIMNADQNWSYLPPRGGDYNEYYRMGDFRQYFHGAEPPLYSHYAKTWQGDPKTVKWFLQNNSLRLNIEFGSAADDGASEWNLKFSDFDFSVFNEQGSGVNLENARLICAVFEGHIDPFAGDTISAAPITWICSSHATTNSNGYGLRFRLSAPALTSGGSFNIYSDTMTAKTLVFMLGVNFTYSSSNFRMYDDTNPYAFTQTSSSKYPSYCVAVPFDREHWPVVWTEPWTNANIKPFASDIESGQVYWKRYVAASGTPGWQTGGKWYTLNETGTYKKAIGGKKYWRSTEENLWMYNGNTNSGYDYKVGISIVIYNNGDQANDFYYSRLYRRIPGVNEADITFLNEN